MDFLPFEMSSWIGAAVMAVAFAILNRLRGMVGILVVLPSLLLAYLVWSVTGNIIWAGVIGGLFMAGESWGWTKWINCIPLEISQTKYNSKWAYPKEVDAPNYESLLAAVIDDKKDYKPYVMVGMLIRGMLWWLPLFAAVGFFGMASWGMALAYTLLLSLLFPLTYWLMFRVPVWEWKYLQRAEPVYGALYGLVFWFLLFA